MDSRRFEDIFSALIRRAEWGVASLHFCILTPRRVVVRSEKRGGGKSKRSCGRMHGWKTVDAILQWAAGALHGDVNSVCLIGFLLEELGDEVPRVSLQEDSYSSHRNGVGTGGEKLLPY
ncbi:hypothetical protein TcG_02253 [Trypanosoma cruzi]|nr:hypothetical protein TcG_02253 [Trypanosoma cruzi]